MEKIQKMFYDNGTVWSIRTSSWTGADKLEAKDIGKENEDIPEIFKLGYKYLVPHETRLALSIPRSKVQALMMRFAKPFFIRGCWFVPNKNLVIVQEGLKKIKSEQEATVQTLIDDLPTIKTEMQIQYPELDQTTWPSDSVIQSKFAIRWNVFEIKGSEVSVTDDEVLAEAKRQFQTELSEEYEVLKQSLLEDAHTELIKGIADLSTKILESTQEGRRLSQASLNKAHKIIDSYESVAFIFDLDSIKAKVEELKNKLNSTNADFLRKSDGYKQDFVNAIAKIGEEIADISPIALGKRVVDID